MDDSFKIYIDRLKIDGDEILEEEFSPDFMDIHEPELQFNEPIKFSGKASLASETLLLQFTSNTHAIMPCAVCNNDVRIKVSVVEQCHSENLEDIKGSVYSFKEVLREAILLEVPMRIECHEGHCPERESMAKYMKKNKESEKEDIYHPFADI